MTETTDHYAQPSRAVYLGLFLITLATLMLELGLTRIFSVIMYYHMAFFAVSVTLFGIAFGAAIVHFFPRVFTAERAARWMARMALVFAGTIVIALAALLTIRFDLTRNRVLIVQLLGTSVLLAAPFTAGGIAVALALTRFPRRTNLLYGFDLAGAALGCLLFPPLMSALGGPRFILATAMILVLAAIALSVGEPRRATAGRTDGVNRGVGCPRVSLAALVVAALLVVIGPRLECFQVRYLRGGIFTSEMLLYDRWNAISRITATRAEGGSVAVAPRLFEQSKRDQIVLLIDMFAATPITSFDGETFGEIFFPFHDASYAVHPLIQDARVAVIGVGGGRDVLAAKAWGQPEVVGIEINGRVIEALTETFNDYAGRPLTWPGVRIVHDEARSYLARSDAKFDVIQASLIDTFAATAAGAFVLTENALYTVEGWRTFLDHLTDRGILTMSRWYNSEERPVESVRLLALARAALETRNVVRVQDHLLMLRTPQLAIPNAQPLATLLVKKTPWTDAQIDRFEAWAGENDFQVLVTPRAVTDEALSGVLLTPRLADFIADYPFDVSPPTDDKPFFFDVLRWRDIFKKEYRQGSEYLFSINLKPLVMLGTLLATVTLMAFLFIVVPLALEKGHRRIEGTSQLHAPARMGRIVYFMMLGLGYIMIELTLMQRFTVFLGHPSYSLTVCLFTMLLASGLGSMAAPRLFGGVGRGAAAASLLRLNLIVFVIQLVTLFAATWLMKTFVAAPTLVRVILAGVTFAPAGFFMGMPFPLALQAAATNRDAPLAWYWGINGAFSVCASVVVVALGHSLGLSGAYVCGTLCYLAAALVSRSFRSRPAEPRK